MKLSILSLLTIGGLLLTVLIAARQGSAQESIDISGTWNLRVTVLRSVGQECVAAIGQQHATVSIELDCADSGELSLTGSIDPLTGDFTTTGVFYGLDMAFFGVASRNSMHGNLSSLDGWGSFRGTRVLPTPTPTPIGSFDLSGDHVLVLYADNPGPKLSGSSRPCLLYLEQHETSVAGAVSCVDPGADRVTGEVQVADHTFSLSWTTSFASIVLTSGPAGSAPGGTFVARLGKREVTGTFYLQYAPTGWWGSIICLENQIGPGPFPPPRSRRNGSLAAVNALRFAAGTPVYESGCFQYLDVNVDGQIDARDAALILQHEAGLIPRLPVL